uniref:hypothetical protein n=1 Tax=Robiginitalea biformata TaxID=252307 RepID=UPI003D324CFE
AKFITTKHSSVFEPNIPSLVHNRGFANLLTDVIFFTTRIEGNYNRIEDDIFHIDSLIQAKYPGLNPDPYIPY